MKSECNRLQRDQRMLRKFFLFYQSHSTLKVQGLGRSSFNLSYALSEDRTFNSVHPLIHSLSRECQSLSDMYEFSVILNSSNSWLQPGICLTPIGMHSFSVDRTPHFDDIDVSFTVFISGYVLEYSIP